MQKANILTPAPYTKTTLIFGERKSQAQSARKGDGNEKPKSKRALVCIHKWATIVFSNFSTTYILKNFAHDNNFVSAKRFAKLQFINELPLDNAAPSPHP